MFRKVIFNVSLPQFRKVIFDLSAKFSKRMTNKDEGFRKVIFEPSVSTGWGYGHFYGRYYGHT